MMVELLDGLQRAQISGFHSLSCKDLTVDHVCYPLLHQLTLPFEV